MLLLDPDAFKEINDTLGHDAGDLQLHEAGQPIRSCVRDSDTVVRLGCEKVTVILSELHKFDSDYLNIGKAFVHDLELRRNDVVLSEAILVTDCRLGV